MDIEVLIKASYKARVIFRAWGMRGGSGRVRVLERQDAPAAEDDGEGQVPSQPSPCRVVGWMYFSKRGES